LTKFGFQGQSAKGRLPAGPHWHARGFRKTQFRFHFKPHSATRARHNPRLPLVGAAGRWADPGATSQGHEAQRHEWNYRRWWPRCMGGPARAVRLAFLAWLIGCNAPWRACAWRINNLEAEKGYCLALPLPVAVGSSGKEPQIKGPKGRSWGKHRRQTDRANMSQSATHDPRRRFGLSCHIVAGKRDRRLDGKCPWVPNRKSACQNQRLGISNGRAVLSG
jgi:hypothetical protein